MKLLHIHREILELAAEAAEGSTMPTPVEIEEEVSGSGLPTRPLAIGSRFRVFSRTRRFPIGVRIRHRTGAVRDYPL